MYNLDEDQQMTLAKALATRWVREAGIGSRAALLAHLEEHRPDVLAAARSLIACHDATGFVDWRGWLLHHWGTNRDAGSADILFSDSKVIGFTFETASSMPEPIFRAIGIQHPTLGFEIEAIDPADDRAVSGEVFGAEARFEAADYREVYERIYGDPPDGDEAEEEKDVEPA